MGRVADQTSARRRELELRKQPGNWLQRHGVNPDKGASHVPKTRI